MAIPRPSVRRAALVTLPALALAALLSLAPARCAAAATAKAPEVVAKAADGAPPRQQARAPAFAIPARAALADSIPGDSTGGGAAHESLGERMAGALKQSGLSDELVVVLVSAMPVVELRAGVPIGIALLGLSPIKVFFLACIGNMLPVLVLTPLLQLGFVQKIAAPVLSRARQKAAGIANAKSRATALAVFVGIPAPGTGAFTGCVVAFVLGMPIVESVGAIFVGVVLAAGIMTILSVAGKVGAALACAALLGFGVSSLVSSRQLRSGGDPQGGTRGEYSPEEGGGM